MSNHLATRLTRRAALGRLAFGAVSLALLGTACQGQPAAPSPSTKREEPKGATPAAATGPAEWNIVLSEQTGGGDPLSEYGSNTQYYFQAQVNEPLGQVELDPKGGTWSIVPHLAEKWSFPDSKTFVLSAKQGVKFHNGEELTAEQVKFTFEGMVKAEKPGRKATLLKPLGEAEIVDKYTVRWRMPAPDLGVLRGLSNFLVVPLARKEMKAEEFERKPIGTGPYKVVDWERDGVVKLEAWDGYRLGKPSPERLTVRYVPEPSTRVAELLAGTAQLVQRLPIESVPTIEANPKLEAVSLKGGSSLSYVINVFKTNPPLRDKRIRQAMNYAVDRDAIVKTILGGRGTALPGPLWSGWMGYTEDIKPYPYDPDKAKALLREAGHPDGFSFDWTITQGVYQKGVEVAQAVASQLGKVGIKANLVPKERARLLTDRNEGDFDVIELVWPMSWDPSVVFTFTIGTPFPDDKLTPKWGPAPAELVEARRLSKEALENQDLDKRAAGYAKVNRVMHDDAFWLFVHTVDEVWGIQKDTRWRPWPATWPDLYWYDYWKMIGRQAPTSPEVPLIFK